MTTAKEQIVTEVRLRGSDAGMRSFLCTVIEEYAIRTEYFSTNMIWVRYIIGRNAPTIRPFKAKTNAGLEFTIEDSKLTNAVEDATRDWLVANDPKFYNEFVGT